MTKLASFLMTLSLWLRALAFKCDPELKRSHKRGEVMKTIGEYNMEMAIKELDRELATFQPTRFPK